MRFNKGFKLALITAGFSGVAVFLNSLTVKAVGDALVFTTIKNLGVAMIIGAVLLRQKINWSVVKANWPVLLAIGVIGGGPPLFFFFLGFTFTYSVTGPLLPKNLIFLVGLWG